MAVAEGMLSRFKGCMLGSLIGDCLGAPFEMDHSVVALSLVNSYIKKLADPKVKGEIKLYTCTI